MLAQKEAPAPKDAGDEGAVKKAKTASKRGRKGMTLK